MRIEAKLNLCDMRAAPGSLYWSERRIDIIEIIDQWYWADYRYVKVKTMTAASTSSDSMKDTTSGRSSCSSRHAAKC